MTILGLFKKHYFEMKGLFIFFSALTVVLYSCKVSLVQVSLENKNIYYQGRVGKTNTDFYEFYWPGTSVNIKATGGDVFARLSDDVGATYYNVIVDGTVTDIIKPEKELKSYALAKNLSEGNHTIELFRRTEYPTGTTRFYGFEISEYAELIPQQKPDLQIVFIGNSITTGYANEDYTGQDRPDSIFTNNYMAYGAIAARYLNADYHCIARGGIGFMVSWYNLIMPDIYILTNPHNKQSKFKPQTYNKRIVVVNLGQNDSWIIPNRKIRAYKNSFGNQHVGEAEVKASYKDFLVKVRALYQDAQIICTLGSMDAVQPGSVWPEYISKAVEQLDDDRISTFFFPFLAKKKHPTVKDHQVMAELLVKHIKENRMFD
jgi:lysophospholipase L1-like esterase